MGSRIPPPERGQAIVTKDFVPVLRVAKFFENLSALLWDTQYIAGTDRNVSITGPAGYALVRGILTPINRGGSVETSDNIWFLDGLVDYTHDSLTSVDITIGGVTFKTGVKQVQLGLGGTGTTQASVSGGDGVITVDHTIATTSTQLRIFAELGEETTWAI